MSLSLPVRSDSVPEGFCFQGFGAANGGWLDLVSLLHVDLKEAGSFFNFGNDIPAPDKRDRPWIRTDADGKPDRTYVYALGQWLSRHSMAPGSVIMYEGSEGSIESFDGGEAGGVTESTGPFWEKVSELDAKIPIGPGTLPSTTVLAVGDDGGEEEHTLDETEIPSHTHTVPGSTTAQGNGDFDVTGGTAGVPAVYPGTSQSSATGGGQPHNNMPPYHAIFFIRRTNRLYYRV